MPGDVSREKKNPATVFRYGAACTPVKRYLIPKESPSGNSKNGLPKGPEVQQGRDYAGPEGLSEGSNPSATAEPMPLLFCNIAHNCHTVNLNIGEARAAHNSGSWPILLLLLFSFPMNFIDPVGFVQ